MRRLALALCVALFGGCAEAGPDSIASNGAGATIAQPTGAASTTEITARIEAFIAAQRRADAESCTAQGHAADTASHRTCVRERVVERRAALAGAMRAQPRRGWCPGETHQPFVGCVDI